MSILLNHFKSYLHFKVVGAGLDLTVQVTSYCTRENAVWLYSQNIFGETKNPSNIQNYFTCMQVFTKSGILQNTNSWMFVFARGNLKLN